MDTLESVPAGHAGERPLAAGLARLQLHAVNVPGSTSFEAKELVRLATPLAVANLGNVTLGLVSGAVVGRLGEAPLAAVGLGNSLYYGTMILGIGTMFGLDPLIAQALGAGERKEAAHAYRQGLSLALLLALPLALLVVGVVYAMRLTSIAPSTLETTTGYVLAKLPGLLPLLLFVASRSYLQAHGLTRPLLFAVILANVVNAPLCQLLVYGDAALAPLGVHVGMPALGAIGAGIANSVASLLQCLCAVVAVRFVPDPRAPRRFDRATIARILRLGVPVGLTMLAEVGVFAGATVVIGTLGTRPLAAHHVAITLASATFQVPLAVGAAASVRVGRAVGVLDTPGARRAGFVALAGSALFMMVTGLTFFLVPGPLASIVSPKAGVVAAAIPLLFVAAVFQLADGAQAVAAGALRGAGDMRVPLVANLIGHYAIGLPVGLTLAFAAGLGATGIWWGLSAGLLSVSIWLVFRFVRLSSRPIQRV